MMAAAGSMMGGFQAELAGGRCGGAIGHALRDSGPPDAAFRGVSCRMVWWPHLCVRPSGVSVAANRARVASYRCICAVVRVL